MDIKFPLLTADQIEVKVKQVSAKGAVLLLYKTARTDMDMLDVAVGPMGWAVEYQEIKGNLYCGIGIADTDHEGRWVWKWDCGTESRADGEGNEKKGEASDAFKRAGFKWGIGRELYTSPFTFARVETEEDKRKPGSYKLKNPFQRFSVSSIEYTDNRVTALNIMDDKGITVFSFPRESGSTTPKVAEEQISMKKPSEAQEEPPQAFHPASQAQKNAILFKLQPVERASMRQKYGENLEALSSEKAGEALAKIKAREAKR